MADRSFLGWPFFDDRHRELAPALEAWRDANVGEAEDADPSEACRTLVAALGAAGWLRHTVPAPYGGASERLDIRTLCLVREMLGYRSGLAEFAFAMQGLGAGPITFGGTDAQKRRYLPGVADGSRVAAFAISEAGAGSDLAAIQTTARRDGPDVVIDGEKTWISNAGIAAQYVVFCRWPAAGDRGVVALIVDADNPGLRVSRTIEVMAPHPLGSLVFDACRVRADAVLGEPGKGMRVALETLDVFRTTVGAAALGLARRAFDEAVAHVKTRQAFGRALADFQLTQASLAEMATAIDAMALLVYRAAWIRDRGAARTTRESSMAKLMATESAQEVVDRAVQLFGGRGVVRGETVERLYREVRALRIYEGTSEIQKLVIAGQVLNG